MSSSYLPADRSTVSTMIKSPYSLDIPPVDVPTYVFSAGTESSRRGPQYFNADSPSQCFSLAQAEGFVKQYALGLQQLGLEPGDRVLLYSNNRLFFPVVIWGTIAAGCVFTAASPTASVSGATILLAGPNVVDVALAAASRAGLSKDRVYVFCDIGEDLSGAVLQHFSLWTEIWSTADDGAAWQWRRITTVDEASSTTAIINYSSGTTGFPKGVEISHYNLVSNSAQFLLKRALVADTPEGNARQARLDLSGERWLAPLPMYHAYGQTYYSMSAARLGAKVFIMNRFDISRYLLFMDVYRITFMTGVPTVIAMLCKQDQPERFNLKAIETVTSGSAPLEPELGARLEQLYLRSGVKVKQGWGMTETTCSISGFAPDDEDDGRSIGWLNPNCLSKIVPVKDRDFSQSHSGTETVGEIWVAGPNIMKGYWNKPEQTAETIVHQDGVRWLRTGDVGYINAQGKIYIIDRMKELIKVKGLQVAPAELELHLLTHPAVADAAVIGAKIDCNEYPRAFVVRKSENVTAEELINMIRGKFGRHKWLTGGCYFVDVIPRTGSGKIVRRALADQDTRKLTKL